jgi:MoxR-like ATPase
MFHIKVNYPTREQEREIIRRTTSGFDEQLRPVISGETIQQCQAVARRVPVPAHVEDFVLDLVRCCRPLESEAPPFVKEQVEWGPGPRACQMLILGGKVRALLRGALHVTVADIEAIALPTLRHRLVPAFNAEAQGVTVDDIIGRVLQAIPRKEPKGPF